MYLVTVQGRGGAERRAARRREARRRAAGWRLLGALLGLAVAAALSGCATIAPYEREALARPEMQMESASGLSELLDHAVAVREASNGGFGGAGGGCGCN